MQSYSEEEIELAISRYGIARENKGGKFREVYQWTLSEFLTRESYKNIERFTAEQWEEPFLRMNGNGQKHEPAPKQIELVHMKPEDRPDPSKWK